MSGPFHDVLPARAFRFSKRRALWAVLGVLSPGCVLGDGAERCGPNQVLWETEMRCVCAEGAAYTADGCVLCGTNEVASTNGCVCDVGYGRPAPTAPCEAIPEGVGTPCSTDAECLNPSYPHCQSSPGGDYCTNQNCAADGDCDGGYLCNLAGEPPYCQRPPIGEGVPCAAPADCAGKDANFCEAFVSFTCMVQGCNLEPDSCFTGRECCDLSGFGLPPLCLPAGACQE
jgi:hypothetical protein